MIIVPKSMEEEVIKRFHNDVREGHPGEARTTEKIRRQFYFPGMMKKIRRWIKGCDDYQRNKINTEKPKGLMQEWNLTPERPWQHLTIDFMRLPETEYPVTKTRLNQVIVVVDRFSKYAILIPSRTDDDTEVVFQLLWEKVFSVFGIPETITSDRDKIFRSKKWIEVVEMSANTEHINHQQTDGQTE
jgi:hypothetical protein